jgi:ElaB/YqjD/DUF883 family membrane-anchored ribosome-binding protein
MKIASKLRHPRGEIMNDQRENFGSLGQTSTSGFAREAERAGQRVGAQVGRLAETAGTKFDSAVDHMGETAQSVKQSLQAMTDEGWEGMKRKAEDYTRKEPWNALLLAIGAGILVGWATRRAG